VLLSVKRVYKHIQTHLCFNANSKQKTSRLSRTAYRQALDMMRT